MITYIKGDLLKSNANVIAHGCNCIGGYNAGIAKSIAHKWPLAQHLYYKKFKSEGWKLGQVQYVKISDTLFIANCATQHSYGGGAKYGKVYVDYKAMEAVFTELYHLSKSKNLKVAIPKIGAGLAGGDWKRIEEIINKIFVDIEIEVYIL